MKKRHELPNFKKIHVEVDVEKILNIFNDNFENLKEEKDNITSVFGSQYVSDVNYDQYLITEYEEKSKLNFKNHLTGDDLKSNERNYTKLADWVKGTYIEEVLDKFKSQYTRCRFCVIRPGGYILPHIDYNTDYSVRYQIPIQTNDWSYFGIQRKNEKPEVRHFPADGSAWFFNPGWNHSAWNMGKTNRIHMIICVNGQEDLKDYIDYFDELPNLHMRASI